MDPPDKNVRSLRKILKCGINIPRLRVVTHRERDLSEIFVMPTFRHTTLFMFGLWFWKQKRAESFGGFWQGATRSDLSSWLSKAFENGILNPSMKWGWVVTHVLSLLNPV